MIDARNIARKVTRKIYDFTPEQQKSLAAIVWLYRGQADRFVALVAGHLERMVEAAGEAVEPLNRFSETLAEAAATQADDGLPDHLTENMEELEAAQAAFEDDMGRFEALVEEISNDWKPSNRNNDSLKAFAERAEPLADASRDLIRQADHLYKLLSHLGEATKRKQPCEPAQAHRQRAERSGRAPESTTLLPEPSVLATGAFSRCGAS